MAAIIAFAAHQWFYVIALYSFLIGMTGGLMAWMVLSEINPDLQGSRTMVVIGTITSAITFVLYEYLRYRFAVSGVDPRLGWWTFLRVTADTEPEFGRSGVPAPSTSTHRSFGPPAYWRSVSP